MILLPLIAFLIGILLGSFLPFLPFSIGLVLLGIAIVLTLVERAGQVTTGRALLLYGCMIGGVVYWFVPDWIHHDSHLLREAERQLVTLEGTVVEPVQHAPNRMIMMVSLSKLGRPGSPRPASGLLRLTWREPDHQVVRGDVIQTRTTIRPPFGTQNPGGFDYGAYLKRKGVQAVATVKGSGRVHVLNGEKSDAWMNPLHWVDQWRSRVRRAAQITLEGPALGLYLGMIIGEQSFIPQEIRDPFMATGTVHIISISGSHLGLLSFLAFFFIKGMCRHLPASWLERLSCRITPTRLAVVTTIPLVSFYALLAGAEVATVRSLVMILLFLLAVWLGRERDLLPALGIAALVGVLHHPPAMFDISFQLSYGAVLAIALVLRWPERGTRETGSFQPVWGKVLYWIRQYWRMNVAVMLATLPLVALYFNQIAWLGLLANVVVVPVVGFLVVPLGLISAGGVLIAGLETLPFGMLNQAVLEVLTQLVSLLANIPGATWHVASPAIMTMVLFYVLAIVVTRRECRPSIRWGCTMGLAFLLVWWLWSPRVVLDQDSLRVTFLDVGQGDSTVIEFPGGQTVLIDGGAAFERWDFGRTVVGPFLWDRGIRRVDHVVATHPQLDHIGGLTWIVQNFQVGTFWTNGVSREEPVFQRLHHAVQHMNVDRETALEGREIVRDGTCRLWSLNPPGQESSVDQGSPSIRRPNLNNLSVVMKLSCGPHSFLFTADAEIEALERLTRNPEALEARVLKIPHHGAKSSLNRRWIEHMESEVAVVSAGRRNRYGHPAETVVETYKNKGVPVFGTNRDGAVWITADVSSPAFTLRTAREQIPIPVRFKGEAWKEETQNWERLWNQWMGFI